MFKFELGEKVKDDVIPFEGVITSRHDYLTGSNRYTVEAIDSTGRPIEWNFDEERLKKI